MSYIKRVSGQMMTSYKYISILLNTKIWSEHILYPWCYG